MTYIHTGKRAHLDALRIRQQIAAAEVERSEKQLAELREVETEILRLQRRKEIVSRELSQARERTTTQRQMLALPLPVYGGRRGLLEAAEEARQHEKRKKEMAG